MCPRWLCLARRCRIGRSRSLPRGRRGDRVASTPRPGPAPRGPHRAGARAWDCSGRPVRRHCCAAGGRSGRLLRRPRRWCWRLSWWLSLQMHQARSPLVVGHGSEEYRRVIVATFRVFAVLAMVSVALQIDASRLYLATAFPLGLVGLLVERKLARVGLHRARTRGAATTKVLVVGGERSAAPARPLVRQAPDRRLRGVRRVGSGRDTPIASLDGVVGRHPGDVVQPRLRRGPRRLGRRPVVVTDTEHLGHESLRDLAWQLEGTGIDLIISPNVLNVSSARLHLQDVSGMPMLHVSEPQYAGAARFLQARSSTSSGATILFAAGAPPPRHGDRRQARARAGLLPPGADRSQRRTVPHDQVPLDALDAEQRLEGTARR